MEGETRRVQLPPRSEYRIELDAGEALSVRFVADPSGHYGDAEVFGAPLIGGTQERWYTFGNEAKFAISSWGGAEIELAGTASTEYMADEPSPVYTYYTNLHLNLERARIRAREQLRTDKNLVQSLKEQDVSKTEAVPSYDDPHAPPQNELYHAAGQGPRLMVVGPECAGKTSLIKFLANYAMRSPALASIEEGLEAERKAQQDEEEALSDDEDGPSARKATDGEEFSEVTGWWPMILALDPSEGAVPVPGCLSAIPLRPTPVNCLPSPSPALPYGVTPQTTGALPPTVSTAESVMPLVHWLGKQNVRENEQHTRRVVDCLAHQVEKRMIKDTRARMSGLLLDMPGVVTSDSRTRYSYIQYCARAFKVDMIVVLGHEKLNLELSKIFAADPAGSAIQIVKMPKSGGVRFATNLGRGCRRSVSPKTTGPPDPVLLLWNAACDPPGRWVGRRRGRNSAVRRPCTFARTRRAPWWCAYAESLLVVHPARSPEPFPRRARYVCPIHTDRIAPSSALPIGAERVVSELQVVKLDPVNSSSDTSSLLHSIVALVDVPSDVELNEDGLPSEMSLLRAGVLGFIHVSEIDTNRKKMTVLSPKPGKLPTKTALIGVRIMVNESINMPELALARCMKGLRRLEVAAAHVAHVAAHVAAAHVVVHLALHVAVLVGVHLHVVCVRAGYILMPFASAIPPSRPAPPPSRPAPMPPIPPPMRPPPRPPKRPPLM